MNLSPRRMLGARSAALVSAGGAVAVQLVTAAGSLILQLLATRSLGVAGYGTYALLYSALVLVTAVQTSWVGDTLTVFDRFDRRIRGALLISLWALTALGSLVGAVVAALMGSMAWAGTLTFALLTALWLLNETGRRVFTARMEFWRLVVNDSVNFAVTLTIIVWLVATGAEVSLVTILAAMCAGLAVSIGLAACRLPGSEYALAPLRGAAVREVVEFAGWRSVQASVRPLSLFVARAMVSIAVSPAVLGGIEAARLLLAPALTVVNGSGYFFLGRFARSEQGGEPARAAAAARGGLTLGGLTLVLALAAVLLVDVLGPLVTRGDFPLDRVALYGWTVYAVCFAATMPLTNLATVRKRSRLIFSVRGIESLIGLIVLAVILRSRPEWASLAPYCLGVGGVISAAVLFHLLRREDPSPAPVAPATADYGDADYSERSASGARS